ncbi:MAG: SIS domain-containing protein [Anaerolineae bacterium]
MRRKVTGAMLDKARGMRTLAEITTQAESWRGGIAAAKATSDDVIGDLRRAAREGVLLIGCGSTHYLAVSLAPWMLAVLGVPTQALPSSELALGAHWTLACGRRALVVALSRSGATSETLMAVERAHALGCQVAAVTCYPDSELAQAADAVIALPEGQEDSFAQTRSFAGMLVATQALAARIADRAGLMAELELLPGLARDAIYEADDLAQSLAEERWKRVSYLGSGWLYGLAGEAMIKMKEMALATAEAFHAMEFRHGPMALVDEDHLVVALLSEGMGRYEEGVLADLCQRGGQIVALSSQTPAYHEDYAAWLQVGADLSELARPVLYLPFVQLLAYHRAMLAGQDPDRPRNVVMAIRLAGTAMETASSGDAQEGA